MTVRLLSAGLWLFLAMWAWNYAAAITGAPEVLGLVFGPAAAGLALLRPTARAARPTQSVVQSAVRTS